MSSGQKECVFSETISPSNDNASFGVTASGMIFGFDEIRTKAHSVSGQVAHPADAFFENHAWATV